MTTQAELIGPLLREVSRSFYLTLRVLPEEIRPPISLAYLLARASDTIADTEVVPRQHRLELLREMRDGKMPAVSDLAEQQALPAERMLLGRLADCYRMLAGIEERDRQRIGELLTTIVSGQIFDLERFPGNALTTDELDRYTYMVAGCVGEFWTKMCRAHLPGMEALDVEQGICFGKGLQLVNILRDMPKDLRIGRCYLPVSAPAALLEPNNFTTIEHIYRHWLDTAAEHLDAGWKYTLAIPANQKRLRLACVWPIWIGLKTIARLRCTNPLDVSQRVKVSRPEVYWIILESALLAGNDTTLDEVYQRWRGATSSARL
jgi:farnesyl-diphosphate farnesyltransferase